jgi:hypothetical protein
VLVAVALALAKQPPVATGETTITAQARADGGAFLPYAPAPAQPVGLCLVDTGVNGNPDTESVAVDREAIDHGAGADVSPSSHGTVLAMMAAAPINGWGMTGTAPGAVRIVSVRVLEAGQTTFPFSSYAAGISECLMLKARFNIRVINLSLGNNEPATSEEGEYLANEIERTETYGVNVVAAAGNDEGSLEFPAALPSVLSVGASDTQNGGPCAFTSGGTGLRLLAPGCGLDGADPSSGAGDSNYWQGTSESSAIAAAALAALEAYRPDLSASAAEELLLTSSDAGRLNIAQAFLDAGLGQIVAAGETAVAGATAVQERQNSPRSVATSNSMKLTARFAGPRARLHRGRHRLRLVIAGRPSEAVAQVRLLARRGPIHRQKIVRTLQGRFTSLGLPRGLSAVSVRYVDSYDAARSSAWETLAIPQPKPRAR